MTTHDRASTGILRSIIVPLCVSAGLVAPFIVLQSVNRSAFHEEFPWALFTFMSLHSLFIVLLLMPAVRRLRSGRHLAASRPGHWAGWVPSAFLLFVYAGVVIDQLPCFLGVPNCG